MTAVCAVALASTACEQGSSAAVSEPVALVRPDPVVQTLVAGPSIEAAVADAPLTEAERAALADQVRRFYEAVDYQLVWIDRDRPSARYHQFLAVRRSAADHGLPPDGYPVPLDEVAARGGAIDPAQAGSLDITTTVGVFRYFLHLAGGRLDPLALDRPDWTLKPRRPDLVAAIADAVARRNLIAAVERLEPSHPQYRELQQALVRYRAIAAAGGWPTVPEPDIERLDPGAQSPIVPVLRQRLAAEGDLEPQAAVPDASVDERLVAALARFQERHRLTPDGTLGERTLQALNVPVDERIRTIALNLERWRWMPPEAAGRHLLVYIPDFRLEAFDEGGAAFDMRVVVGTPKTRTPIFADEMTHVVFSPYWNVPPGIARDETLPRAAKDPGFLVRNNMEVVTRSGEIVDPYSIDWADPGGVRIRQRPGRGNALGAVKFLFPNTFDVYLHDTNATKLFHRIERAFSHGCVRVEEPHKLAGFVLRGKEWTEEAIANAMAAGRERHVKLDDPLPVFLVYMTARSHQGGVRFLKDIYGHDAAHAALLWPDED